MTLTDAAPFVLFVLFAAGLWLALFNLLPFLLQGSRHFTRTVASWTLRNEVARRWIGRRQEVIRPYLPVALIVAAGLAITLSAGDGFLDLAEELAVNSPVMQKADHSVYEWVRSLRSEPATRFFVFFTILGSPAGLGVIVLMAAVVTIVTHHPKWTVYLAATTAGGALLNLTLKDHFERARPDLAAALRQAHGFSFPSGHAMGSTIVFAALGYLAIRSLSSWGKRSAAISVAASCIVAVCASRIYLGVHWITDIAAGVTAGLLWVTTTTVGYEIFRRIRAMRR